MIVSAVVVPHPPIAVSEIGHGEEKKMQKTLDGYARAAEVLAESHPDTLIVTSPHATMYRDYFQISPGKQAYGDFGQFRASEVTFNLNYDEELTSALSQYLSEIHFPGGTDYDREPALDHGTMVPMYFIRKKLPNIRIVRIGLSGLPLTMHYQLGMAIASVAEQLHRRIGFVASGDLAHDQSSEGPYGYKPEGPEYDKKIMNTMASGNFLELFHYDPVFLEKAMECGHRSFVIMAGALDRTDAKGTLVSHEAPFGIGYGVVTYEIGGKNESRNFLDQYMQEEENKTNEKQKKEDAYVSLARSTVNSWVKNRKMPPVPQDLPQTMLDRQAGAFVSIHENGELRGCIGTIGPTQKNIAQEIMHNAVSASTRDPRFEPIEEKELPYLEISVDILEAPEVIPDKSMLDVKKYGVICSKHERLGLLLPNLDGVDSVDQQIEIACRKGGIDPDEEGIELQRFEVVRHE